MRGSASKAFPPSDRPRTGTDGVIRGRVESIAQIGALVRVVRKELGLTQQDLADHADTGRRFVSELERGKESIELGKALAVCAAIGIDFEIVLRRRPEPDGPDS